MSEPLWQLSCAQLRQRLAGGETSAVEVASAFLERIAALNGDVHAFLHTADALQMARDADRRLQSGERGPLLGIPLAVKDIICIRDLPNTCGSRILQNFVPPYDAHVIQRLREAGAVFLGKTNLDEFAMGSSTENSAFGPTRNPWNLACVPGGSSGGSAAAVAAGMAPLALGTDTGGSIRQPAALCGVTGLKPTYGRVSRYGLVAFASSLDQIGPIGKDVWDCAALLGVMAGADGRDSTSAPMPVPDYLGTLELAARGLRLGLPREFLEGLDASIAEPIQAAARLFEKSGASLHEVSLPHLKYALPAYYIIAPAEASSNLARYDGTRYGYRSPEAADVQSMFRASRHDGFGAEVKRRIMVGTYALSAGYYDAYYLKAQKVRTLIKNDFERAFADTDALLGPATPTVAFPIGEKAEDPLQMYLADIYTTALNLAGLPGLVVPCGFSRDLPVGLQIIGPAFSEQLLLSIGACWQSQTDFHLRRPRLEARV